MRAFLRALSAAALAGSIMSCTNQQDPVSPMVHGQMKRAAYEGPTVSASSEKLVLLMVDVSGGGLEKPLRYDLVLRDGRSESPLPLPEGKGYDVAFRGYDAGGTQTHAGK